MVTIKPADKQNAMILNKELSWFEAIINTRLELYFGHESAYASIWDIAVPVYEDSEGSYAAFIKKHNCTPQERLLLMLVLAPHIKPQALDVFSIKNGTYDKGFTEFGGLKGVNHGGFLPTAETAVFLLAGDDLSLRLQAMKIFVNTHYLLSEQIIILNEASVHEPFLSSGITVSPHYVDYFLHGLSRKANYNNDFPARLITTEFDWNDLILPPDTFSQLLEIQNWIKHSPVLMNEWGFGKKMKPGFKSLFYGPPGTGKTLAACLIGKFCQLDVYRIDLSAIVSKYIGETEKNLEKVFQIAEHKNWILFFDEADALFGKRTSISNSHDRYANQETAYLLQRIEDFDGVVILASNLKNNIDEAFARRFQSIIYFPVPRAEERLMLWQKAVSRVTELEEELDLASLAKKYELSGGTIMNVMRYCSLMAISRNEKIIRLSDAEKGIQKELLKEGRIM
jgi:hypothetical protein